MAMPEFRAGKCSSDLTVCQDEEREAHAYMLTTSIATHYQEWGEEFKDPRKVRKEKRDQLHREKKKGPSAFLTLNGSRLNSQIP